MEQIMKFIFNTSTT